MTLQDTTPHPQVAEVQRRLDELQAVVDALPLESAQAHIVTQEGFFRFRAALNTVVPVKKGPGVIIVDGLPTVTEVSDAEG